jgi:hypothetical protein
LQPDEHLQTPLPLANIYRIDSVVALANPHYPTLCFLASAVMPNSARFSHLFRTGGVQPGWTNSILPPGYRWPPLQISAMLRSATPFVALHILYIRNPENLYITTRRLK